ncbi:hypothetical protein HK097_006045 [Rhizophlyctis rosea]|uniref:Uncharacterized protein n=1 Tax=Rhizophlyctis rosea TaxID=64517 RepID=A0AAD5SG30_9FUNG|nr:hypothetical protein HK097_006045 [Rhizophlyctis rosea]
MPGRPVDSTLYMTSASKKSTATRWAEDWRAAERRLDQEDAMEEQRMKDAGGVVPPRLIQTVKNVNVVNMPTIEEMVQRGLNSGAGISGQSPSYDFPGNPPPPDGGKGKGKRRNTYGNGYGGGGGNGGNGTMPGAFPDVIVPKKNAKSEDVASINPLSKELTLTDRDTIMDEVDAITTKTETKVEVKQELPQLLSNPITDVFSPAATAANQVSSLPNSILSVPPTKKFSRPNAPGKIKTGKGLPATNDFNMEG